MALKLVKIGNSFASPRNIEAIGEDPDEPTTSIVTWGSGNQMMVPGMKPTEVLMLFNRAIDTDSYGDPES